ncbi:hypothetical protein IAD21_04981 [Abditibacteriota bacterium]|nr:hypothetical protein IAD21_04981 [Abditibacteriota bacterium]
MWSANDTSGVYDMKYDHALATAVLSFGDINKNVTANNIPLDTKNSKMANFDSTNMPFSNEKGKLITLP